MKSIRIVTILTLSLGLLLIVLQNTAPVATRFLWFKAEVPAILLLLLAAGGGFVHGLLVPWFLRGGGNAEP